MTDGKPLRVLFDAAEVNQPPTGVGIYARELVSALAARDDVQVSAAFPGSVPAGATAFLCPRRRTQSWRQFVLPWQLAKGSIDVYHGAVSAVPVICPVPRVATVHDLSFIKFPRAYTRTARFQLNASLKVGLRAERIITPSAAVADDLAAITSYPRSRVRVVHLAPSSEFTQPPAQERGGRLPPKEDAAPYLLFVGVGTRRKRAVDIIRALRFLPDVRAVLVGGHLGGGHAGLMREARRIGVAERVGLTGHVDDDALAGLYRSAVALVYPSLDEGFGIPPLEAMSCGTPVIATGIPTLREVLGDAALFVPVRAPEEIAQAATRLLDNEERRDWVGRGREHAARFSWERAAEETAAVYRELV